MRTGLKREMDALTNKLKELQEKRNGLQKPLVELLNKIKDIEDDLRPVLEEIEIVEQQIEEFKNRNSDILDDNKKFSLKEAFDKIGQILLTKTDADSLKLLLLEDEKCGNEYKIEITGDLMDYVIKISTNSNSIKSLLRRCFTQELRYYEHETKDQKLRSEWQSCPDSYPYCDNFTYDSDLAATLLCPEDDVYKYKKWRNTDARRGGRRSR